SGGRVSSTGSQISPCVAVVQGDFEESFAEIQIRKLRTMEHDEPCTIRMEVDGHDRWMLDLRFPRNIENEQE
ncbi:MAG: hypothetical protein CL981_00900, partial [Euryarchaeota archaeon]|nr:hypothetical protein [Euryarchaeota archaeon]